MRNQKGFDQWADEYESFVKENENAETYPFAGYQNVIGTIFSTIIDNHAGDILDVGFGTGVLAKQLYDKGCHITGVDFSKRMIEIAGEKMPRARLIQHDFSAGLPSELGSQKYDAVTITYAIHHLTMEQKEKLINDMLEHLKNNGMILIGDVAFEDQNAMDQCAQKAGDAWDSSEMYLTADEVQKHFPQAQFHKISYCSGIFVIVHQK